jgi:hypothetical protein
VFKKGTNTKILTHRNNNKTQQLKKRKKKHNTRHKEWKENVITSEKTAEQRTSAYPYT